MFRFSARGTIQGLFTISAWIIMKRLLEFWSLFLIADCSAITQETCSGIKYGCILLCFSLDSAGILGLKGYVAERKGEREEMQDAHVILNDITEECSPLCSQIIRVSYFAVFDGHGGVRASTYAAQNLHQNLIRKFPKGEVHSVEKAIRRCILDTFKHTDEEFLKQASSQKPAWKDGSTATCVLVIDNTLYIANLGDSRAILCRYNEETQKHTALSLSKEHNPTQYDERMRIQKAGGNVREGRVLGVLEVSRSIGDGQYKRFGVISVPDVKRCQLTHNDRFILLACDGLFKVFSPEEAVNFIMCCLEVRGGRLC
uniref:Integrin-linked kinase-associated serine/threonine phosphatase 2C n=1 Tax=Pseudonaja textilis TaxID=8673 RepID=A0A670ZTT5_PSETE